MPDSGKPLLNRKVRGYWWKCRRVCLERMVETKREKGCALNESCVLVRSCWRVAQALVGWIEIFNLELGRISARLPASNAGPRHDLFPWIYV